MKYTLSKLREISDKESEQVDEARKPKDPTPSFKKEMTYSIKNKISNNLERNYKDIVTAISVAINKHYKSSSMQITGVESQSIDFLDFQLDKGVMDIAIVLKYIDAAEPDDGEMSGYARLQISKIFGSPSVKVIKASL